MEISNIFYCFTILCALFKRSVSANDSAHQCGGFPLSEMQPFTFVSDETGQQVELLKIPSKNSSGFVSTIYIGYNGGLTEPFSAQNCVAIKLTPRDEEEAYRNSVEILRNIKAILPDARKRSLIINVHAYGEHADGFVTVMELAEGGHKKVYKAKNFHHQSNKEIERQIVEFIAPLEQYHQVAIHLDIWRPNFVYVAQQPVQQEQRHEPEGSQRPLMLQLKLIDFDQSMLLPDFLPGNEQKMRVNFQIEPRVIPYRYAFTAGPEYRHHHHRTMVSTKTDIWAVGMVFYELILLQPKYGLNESSRIELLNKIGDIYSGFKWVFQSGAEIVATTMQSRKAVPLEYYGRHHWVLEYADALFYILEVRAKWPRIFLLITNMLLVQSARRPSAAGVLDYLRGHCTLPLLSSSTTTSSSSSLSAASKKLELFNGISAEGLHKLLAKMEKEEGGNLRQRQKLLSLMELLVSGNAPMAATTARLLATRIDDAGGSSTKKKTMSSSTDKRMMKKERICEH